VQDSGQGLTQRLLACAVNAAHAGGRILLEGAKRRQDLVVTHKRLNDLVSEVDRNSEQAIVQVILREFPDHRILAEEGSANPEGEGSGTQWIIDPLDGTTNFLHGFDHFAVSIGVVHDGQLVAGVVFDPVRGHCFEARRGAGAFLNGKRLQVADRAGIAEALVSTGLPYPSAPDAADYFRVLHQVWLGCRNVRRPGAAALDLAYVAAGFLDGFFEFALLPWDIAAGALLVQEAGGCISDLHGGGDFLRHGYIAAGTPAVHRDLLGAVQAADIGPAWYRHGPTAPSTNARSIALDALNSGADTEETLNTRVNHD
jgi:myo-inositol-1(or 4)-monophosphatase